jgi:hypothetical protein
MIGELADDDEGDQAGSGDAPRDGLGRDRRAGHAVAAGGAGVLGQDVDVDVELSRDELERAGLILSDAPHRFAAAGAGRLRLGQIVLDADVIEMVQPGPSRRACGLGSRGCRDIGRAGRRRLGLDDELGDVEEMALARVLEESFAAPAEEVAAQQCQGLFQLGVFLLQLVVLGRGPVEHALEFVGTALGVVGTTLGVVGTLPGSLGLLPQRVVAAQQVFEQPPAFRRIVRELQCDAHNMNYTRSFMLCKSTPADFNRFSPLRQVGGTACAGGPCSGRYRTGAWPVAPAGVRRHPG